MATPVLRALACCLILALGSANPADVSALLQTVVQGRAEGIPDEPDEPKQLDDDLKASEQEPIKVGDKMEVIVLQGAQAGQWIKCKVMREGENKNSFDVLLTGIPGRKRFVPNVPAAALRRYIEESQEKSDGILLFWAVSSKPYTMQLVKKNVDYLRRTYSGRADVYLVHYDNNKEDWVEDGEDWYQQNVQFSETRKVPKQRYSTASMLFAQEYYPMQVSFARKLAPELLAKRQYDWVWLLDEDVDFTSTNLTSLFAQAEDTGSLIVAPSVKFQDRYQDHPETKGYMSGCTLLNAMCFMHVPKPGCQYRYTNFIEAMFPIMKPEVLADLASCPTCENAIDHLWCARSARTLDHPADQACSILDKSTVVHTNGKTLRKWEAVSQLHDNIGDVRGTFPEDFVDGGDLADFRCVKPNDGPQNVPFRVDPSKAK